MKTILLILLAISLSFTLKAQDKKELVKAPVYVPNLSAPHDVVLKGVTIQQINDFIVFQQRGEKINEATDLSAKQVTDIITNARVVIIALDKQLSSLLDEDKKKWQARQDDSLKAVSAQIKKP